MAEIKVTLGQYKGLKVNKVPVDIPEGELEAALNKLHQDHAPDMPLDDEFARKAFGFESLAALKAALEEQLLAGIANEAKVNEENAAVDAAVANAQVEVPEELVNAEVEKEFALLCAKMEQNGMKMEQYLSMMGVTKEDYLAQARPNVVQQFKVKAVLEAVATAENIVITDEDVENELQRVSANYGVDISTVRADLGTEFVRKNLASQQALDIIVNNAEYI